MEAEQSMKLHEAYPMKGGDGLNSYAKNSSGQVDIIYFFYMHTHTHTHMHNV